MSKIEIPKEIQEAADELYDNKYEEYPKGGFGGRRTSERIAVNNEGVREGKAGYIKGALAERAKSEVVATGFAEWVSNECFIYYGGSWTDGSGTRQGEYTTAQLFTLYQNDKMK